MGISGNSSFQKPPTITASDVINFQLGISTLQASFTKALQEPDTESVVIANLHQPIQPIQVEMPNARVRKKSGKKGASLNQQIRDIIYKSIKNRKRSENLPADDNIEDKEESMFTVDHSRATKQQLKEEKIREDHARGVRTFDENIRTSSYRSSLDTEFIREPEQKEQESSHKSLQSQETPKRTEEEEFSLPNDDTEVINEEFHRDNIEEPLEDRESISKPELSIDTHQKTIQVNNNIPAPTTPSITTIAPSSPISPHCIMSLPPDFFELFEKLVGVMIVQQNNSGITEVTVTIKIPGSILDESEVRLEFFDTNPRSCNVELRGSPKAVDHFQKYHGEFVAAFQQSKLSLDINIRRPSLLQKKKIINRKK